MKIRLLSISLLFATLLCLPSVQAKDYNNSTDKSDLNLDQSIDIDDVMLFSTNYLYKNWEIVDWCQFYDDTAAGNDFDGRRTKYYKKHFSLLLAFINEDSNCNGEPYLLELENSPRVSLRITRHWNSNGDHYVTDPRVGSLFIYDANMVLKGEIKGLSRPLGVAVDSLGYLLVGNDGRDNIEVYDPADGVHLMTFGEGLLQMPNAITLGPDNNIYVTDSRASRILVFNPEYQLINTIGAYGSADAELDFPIDAEVIPNLDGELEIFVADQGNKRIKIFDTSGSLVAMIDPDIIPPPTPLPKPDPYVDNNGDPCPEPCTGWMCGYLPPPPPECNPTSPRIEFSKLQALSSDSIGRLHTLDIFEATTSIFELVDGEWVWKTYYGEYGTGAGQLYTPTDVLVTTPGLATVIPGNGERIEVLTTQ
jgi:hypothetical protein